MDLQSCKKLIRDFKSFTTIKLMWEGQRLEIIRNGRDNFDLSHKNINTLYGVDSKTVLGKLKDISTSSSIMIDVLD